MGDVLRIRVFAVLFSAEVQSLAGDQLARVALSVLVFDRTHNAAATAATYAATFLPAIAGGAVLARIGDRLSRRRIMIFADLVRAVLFTAMAVPSLPLVVVEVLLVLAVFLEPAFTAAQSSFLAGAMGAEEYRAATGMRMAANQITQVVGFAVGGALVVAVDPRGALLIDGVTFAVSAAMIMLGLRGLALPVSADSPQQTAGERPRPRPFPGRPWRIRGTVRVTDLIALASLAGFFVVPEGLVIPLVQDEGVSTRAAGVLLAAIPAGGVVGALVLLRGVRSVNRSQATLAMVVFCGLPLLVTALHPPWPVLAVAWFASGAAAAYQIEVFSELAQIVPNAHRARVLGITSAFLTGAQGVGLAVFGLVAAAIGPARAVAVAGGAGVICACAVAAASYRHRAGSSRPASPLVASPAHMLKRVESQ